MCVSECSACVRACVCMCVRVGVEEKEMYEDVVIHEAGNKPGGMVKKKFDHPIYFLIKIYWIFSFLPTPPPLPPLSLLPFTLPVT